MKITKTETWFCRRNPKFQSGAPGGAPFPWDVVLLRLGTAEGFESTVSFLASKSGLATEENLHEAILPLVLGRDTSEREAIWNEFQNYDRRLTFFPAFLPGPVDVALWELASLEAGLPLFRYMGAKRTSLPVYAAGVCHESAAEYGHEAVRLAASGIGAYKARPRGPWRVDMEIASSLRKHAGPEMILLFHPCADYSLDEAITVGKHLEGLGFLWLQEPFRDYQMTKYRKLSEELSIPVAASETTRGPRWDADALIRGGVDIALADISWENGITGALKIAALAEELALPCELPGTSMGLMDLVNVHAACAISNVRWFEYPLPAEKFCFPLKTPLKISGGRISPCEIPGLGADISWDDVDNQCVSKRMSKL